MNEIARLNRKIDAHDRLLIRVWRNTNRFTRLFVRIRYGSRRISFNELYEKRERLIDNIPYAIRSDSAIANRERLDSVEERLRRLESEA